MRRTFSRSGARQATRHARIDARIDTDTGQFDMVMATEGEASDGHVISIAGLALREEIPLQLDHSRSAMATLGTVRNMRRDKIDGLPVMRGVGQIRLTGEGDQAEARRDLVDAIASEMVRGVSMTWDSDDFLERRDLSKSHAAHVARDEKNPRKRFGLFFKSSTPIEQSIVGVPADREALIGRAENAKSELSRSVFQTLVSRIVSTPEQGRDAEIIEALEANLAGLETRLRAAEAKHAPRDTLEDPPKLELLLDGIARQVAAGNTRSKSQLEDMLETLLERI